jgi:hypothetical protein
LKTNQKVDHAFAAKAEVLDEDNLGWDVVCCANCTLVFQLLCSIFFLF